LGIRIELEIVALPGVYLIVLEDWMENGEWRSDQGLLIPRTESTKRKPDGIDSLLMQINSIFQYTKLSKINISFF
jgi:hypothetical protein